MSLYSYVHIRWLYSQIKNKIVKVMRKYMKKFMNCSFCKSCVQSFLLCQTVTFLIQKSNTGQFSYSCFDKFSSLLSGYNCSLKC